LAYNSLTGRTDAASLVPEVYSRAIIQDAIKQSAALSLFRHINMSTNQTRMSVLSALPVAGFVNGDTGLKATTKMAWANKYLNVEEIAIILPIPENVLMDQSFDLWGEIKPRAAEAIGRTLDAAVFFGTNKPSTWPTAIGPAAIAAGNYIARGTNNAAAGGIAQDISDAMAKVEGDGFDVTAFAAARSYKGRLRGARDSTGQPLADLSQDKQTIYGERVMFNMDGLFAGTSTAPEFFAMQADQFLLGVRQDITAKVLTEATLQDAEGNTVFNLAQQDMVALRLVARYAFQVANPMTYSNTDDSTRYPAAVLETP
jgi:HK97 family phage major capsid protein